jgi:hypothetical protein
MLPALGLKSYNQHLSGFQNMEYSTYIINTSTVKYFKISCFYIIILGEEISGWKTKFFKCPVISEKDDGKYKLVSLFFKLYLTLNYL